VSQGFLVLLNIGVVSMDKLEQRNHFPLNNKYMLLTNQ